MIPTSAILGALLLAARAADPAGVVKNPGTFVSLEIADVDSLDPAWANDTASNQVILQVYEPLLAYKGSSVTELEPRIASSVPSRANGLVSRDRRTYRFPIRTGVRFHDGTVLTPEDVKYSVMRFCLQDRDGGPSFNLLEPLVGRASLMAGGRPMPDAFKRLDAAIQIRGDEVVFRLPEPFAPFLSVLAVWSPIVSRAWSAARGGWDGKEASWEKFHNPKKEDSPFLDRANGTGPFRLERWTKEAREVHLARHEAYWRRPAALARAVFRSVPEFATRRLMLAAGDADSIVAERAVLPALLDAPGVVVTDDLPLFQSNPVIFFNFRVEPTANPDIGSGRLDGDGIPPDFFSDIRVRQAFAHAVDAEAYIRDVSRGKGTPAGGCIPKGLLGFDPALRGRGFDLGLAAERLREAWGGQVWERGFRLTLPTNIGNSSREILAQMLKRNIESLNPKFRIDLRPLQWSSYLQGLHARKLPIYILGWTVGFADPHGFAFPLLHSQGVLATRQGFADARLDALIERARREADPARRERLYGDIQRRAHSLSPHLYLQHGVGFRAQRAWVRGWVPNPMFPGFPYGTSLYPLSKE